jgi:hypothetical protein
VVARGLGEYEHAIDLLNDACRYGERTSHPLLLGIAYTIRGFASLEVGDPVAAETDAHAVLAVVKPYGVAEAARVGPKGPARLCAPGLGDVDAALTALAEGRRERGLAVGVALAAAGGCRIRGRAPGRGSG